MKGAFNIFINNILKRPNILLHSGRTDLNLGHKDNNNISNLGYYHYHYGNGPEKYPKDYEKASLINSLKLYGAKIITSTISNDKETYYIFEAIIELEKLKRYFNLKLNPVNKDGFYLIENSQTIKKENFFGTQLRPTMIKREDSKWIGLNGGFDYNIDKNYLKSIMKKYFNLESYDTEIKQEEFIKWLSSIEKPFRKEDFIWQNEEQIAIKPHNSNDGYVTIGYGHTIQSDEEAIKYGFITGKKQSISEVISSIIVQGKKYNDNENPAILTIDKAKELLLNDLVSYRSLALKFANETKLTFSKNEIDAMTSLVYNGNKAYDPDSLLYNFLRKDKIEALKVLHKAEDNGWYGSNSGLFRRRLMEFNIFFNNDYEFFDSERLDELKNLVGY